MGEKNFSKHWCDWSCQNWYGHKPYWCQFWKIKRPVYTCANANWRPFLWNTLPAASSLCVDQVKALNLASDHVLCQLHKYSSNSIIIGLSKRYQVLPYHWISALSYTDALLLLIDQAPALKMEFKLLEAESTGERIWFSAFDCPNCLCQVARPRVAS